MPDYTIFNYIIPNCTILDCIIPSYTILDYIMPWLSPCFCKALYWIEKYKNNLSGTLRLVRLILLFYYNLVIFLISLVS